MRARNKTSTVVFEKTTAILEAGRAHLPSAQEHSSPHILAITLNHATSPRLALRSLGGGGGCGAGLSFEGDEARAVAGERAVMILVCRDAMGNALSSAAPPLARASS